MHPLWRHLFKHFTRFLLVGSVGISCGLGTALIQLLAWSTMVPTQFVETHSWSKAFVNTVDPQGEHACSLCELAQSINPESNHQPKKSLRVPQPFNFTLLAYSISKPFTLPTSTLGCFPSPLKVNPPDCFVLSIPTPPPMGKS